MTHKSLGGTLTVLLCIRLTSADSATTITESH